MRHNNGRCFHRHLKGEVEQLEQYMIDAMVRYKYIHLDSVIALLLQENVLDVLVISLLVF